MVPLNVCPAMLMSRIVCSVLALLIFCASVVNSCCPCADVGDGVSSGFLVGACGLVGESPHAARSRNKRRKIGVIVLQRYVAIRSDAPLYRVDVSHVN